MEHRVHFVLDHSALDGSIIFECAVDDRHAPPESAADQL
jgi:hypothetical protein